MAAVDYAIIVFYFAVVIGLGFWYQKRASKNLEAYFLGGKSLPWYMLGLSNASGQFDISGTMMMVAWLFVYGVPESVSYQNPQVVGPLPSSCKYPHSVALVSSTPVDVLVITVGNAAGIVVKWKVALMFVSNASLTVTFHQYLVRVSLKLLFV